MTMISRDWTCLNPRCGKTFHSYEKGNPPCTHCGGMKVAWVPGGGHIAKVSPGVDATARGLAETYKLSNINTASPSRLNRSKPALQQPPVEPGPPVQFAPGFAAPVSKLGATCSPSTALIKATGKVLAGDSALPMPRSQSFPRPQDHTKIIARHAGSVRGP